MLTLDYFLARVRKVKSGCWLWVGPKSPGGYGKMSIGHSGKYWAHRFSYEKFVCQVKSWDGFDCCHTCDVRACVNPAHLFKATRLENIRDCQSKGRTKSVFSEELAIKIIDFRIKETATHEQISMVFDVKTSNIRNLLSGTTQVTPFIKDYRFKRIDRLNAVNIKIKSRAMTKRWRQYRGSNGQRD